MLDFYLKYGDDDSIDLDVDESLLLGSFSLEQFQELDRLGIVEHSGLTADIHFFEDCVLHPDQISAICEQSIARKRELERTPGFASSSVNRFIAALEKAIDAKCSLMLICD